jgi:hypothetical protein
MLNKKKLLLTDLCARLPYWLKCEINGKVEILDSICDDDGYYFNFIGEDKEGYTLDEVKPYLFPMSAMTEDIKDEIYQETGLYDIFEDNQIHIEVGTNFADVCKLFNILNKYYLDYNGLIPKGLAKDATGLNIY